MTKFPKILITIFLLVFILQLASLIFLLVIPEISKAEIVKPTLQVPIGDFDGSKFSNIENLDNEDKYLIPWIGEYITAIYNYAIGIVGILAAVVLMFGGILWLTAGGSAEKIGNAKSWIGAALTGLVLTLASYMILNTINPDLLKFKPIEVLITPDVSEKIDTSRYSDCEWSHGLGSVHGERSRIENHAVCEKLAKNSKFYKHTNSNTISNYSTCYCKQIAILGYVWASTCSNKAPNVNYCATPNKDANEEQGKNNDICCCEKN